MKSLGPRSGNLTSIRFRTRFLISMSLNFLICFHCFYFDHFTCTKPVHCPQSCYDLTCLGSRGPPGHCCRARLWAPRAAAKPAEPLASRGLLSSTPLLSHLPSFSFWTEWFRKEGYASLLWVCVCSVAQSCLTLCNPMDYSPSRLLCPWDFPGENIGVSCHFLLQGIFSTQELNPCLLHWQVDSLPSSHLGSLLLLYFSLLLVCLFWLKYKEIKPFNPKGSQPWIFTGRADDWSWSSNTLATWCEELTHWKRPRCWERLRAGEAGDRGWDNWMASPTQWTQVWANSRR